MGRFLTIVERGGNALPHPATLFLLFALGTIVVSEIAARLGISAIDPRDGESVIVPFSLMSIEGLHRILTDMEKNNEQSREHAVAEGTAIAREMLDQVRSGVNGVQVSAPFGKVDLALQVFAT
jgi:hypothetical protein